MNKIRSYTNTEEKRKPLDEKVEKYLTSKGKYSVQRSEDRKEELKTKIQRKILRFTSLESFTQNYYLNQI